MLMSLFLTESEQRLVEPGRTVGAAERHDQVDIGRALQFGETRDQIGGGRQRIGHDRRHEDALPFHALTSDIKQFDLIVIADMVHEAGAGDGNHARSVLAEGIVAHQIVDVLGVSGEVNAAPVEWNQRDADDAVERVEKCRRFDCHEFNAYPSPPGPPARAQERGRL